MKKPVGVSFSQCGALPRARFDETAFTQDCVAALLVLGWLVAGLRPGGVRGSWADRYEGSSNDLARATKNPRRISAG